MGEVLSPQEKDSIADEIRFYKDGVFVKAFIGKNEKEKYVLSTIVWSFIKLAQMSTEEMLSCTIVVGNETDMCTGFTGTGKEQIFHILALIQRLTNVIKDIVPHSNKIRRGGQMIFDTLPIELQIEYKEKGIWG